MRQELSEDQGRRIGCVAPMPPLCIGENDEQVLTPIQLNPHYDLPICGKIAILQHNTNSIEDYFHPAF
jgi:hypothetical protein